MRSYFSQFGTVARLRLSRNKKTGNSRHYAFIEFAESEVAKIVAETMNNYLLFNHILKCKIVPRDDLEFIEKLFKGSGKKFKPRPGARLHQRVLERKRTEEQWGKQLVRETSKRKAISQKLKHKGIEYEYEAPEVRKAEPESMEVDETPGTVAEEIPVAAIEEVVVEESVPEKVAPEKKNKKGKRNTSEAMIEEPVTVMDVKKAVTKKAVPEKKGKTGKKEKKGVTEATPAPAVGESTIEEEEKVPEKVVSKRRGRGKKDAEALVVAVEETAAVEEVVPEKKKGRRGKNEVVKKVVEKPAEEAVEGVTEGDGIDEVEVQAAVKKAKSKPKPKSPAKAKSPAGKVVKKPAPRKKSKA